MKKVINTKNAPSAIGPYSQGIIINNMVYTSGQLPINVKSGEMPKTIEEQTRESLMNVKAIVEEAGSSLQNIIKTTVFLSDMNNFGAMNEVYKEFFTEDYPSRSAIEVARLPKDALVEVEVVAVI
ncbi:MAG: RidA family protein [Firmicutes bacterium]|nr:RidA family protein [Bacillota bacterium]